MRKAYKKYLNSEAVKAYEGKDKYSYIRAMTIWHFDCLADQLITYEPWILKKTHKQYVDEFGWVKEAEDIGKSLRR